MINITTDLQLRDFRAVNLMQRGYAGGAYFLTFTGQ